MPIAFGFLNLANFSNFSLWSLFFWDRENFLKGRDVSGSGKPSGSGKFFHFYCFFVCLTWKLDPNLKISIFERLSDFIIFSKLKFSSLDRIFKLKYTKKAIKVKKISAAARLATAAHASPCKKVIRLEKKKVMRVKIWKTQFLDVFF